MAADMTRVWRAQIFEDLGRADEASAELEALLGREQLSAEARAAAQLCLAELLLDEGRERERILALITEARTHFESRKMKLALARVAAVQLAVD